MVTVLLKVVFVHVFSCLSDSKSTGSCLCSSPHGDHGECFVEGGVCACVRVFR